MGSRKEKYMTKEVLKQAFEDVQKEISSKEIEIYKEYFKKTLQKIEEKKKQKEQIEEELRILKLDLDELKEGKLEKIKERQVKSELANKVSVVKFSQKQILNNFPVNWYTGTYIISCTNNTQGNFYRTFYF